MPIPVLYLVASVLVASLGTKRKWGFWGFFVLSVILTPIVSLIVIMATDPIEKTKEQ